MSEVTARDIANLKVAKRGENISKIARESYEMETVNSAITIENTLVNRYNNMVSNKK